MPTGGIGCVSVGAWGHLAQRSKQQACCGLHLPEMRLMVRLHEVMRHITPALDLFFETDAL